MIELMYSQKQPPESWSACSTEGNMMREPSKACRCSRWRAECCFWFIFDPFFRDFLTWRFTVAVFRSFFISFFVHFYCQDFEVGSKNEQVKNEPKMAEKR